MIFLNLFQFSVLLKIIVFNIVLIFKLYIFYFCFTRTSSELKSTNEPLHLVFQNKTDYFS